jgi:cyanophycinase-like exopeptidase
MGTDYGQLPRLLVIMGSGETSPTMTTVHQELFARFGAPVRAVLMDTPFGFQENADEIAQRALRYFREHVGREVEVATLRNRVKASALEYESFLARLAEAQYVFSGPGSPTYALRQWRGEVTDLLAEKLRSGGCVVFASAAAAGLGELALPVYEIYKVGEDTFWAEGLDLLREAGLRCAVIPHYNNAEGGTHDTRYCYMGERRLRQLEATLPEGVSLLGVDEHTACLLDLDAATLTVRGRGGVTLRRRGAERRFQAGTVALAELREEVQGTDWPAPDELASRAQASADGAAASPLAERTGAQLARANQALESGDVSSAVAALLDLESELHEWETAVAATDERDLARAAMRRLVVRVGELARLGASDPRAQFAPLVGAVLGLRDEARRQGRWAEADKLRDLLVKCGFEVRDTPAGTEWELAAR